MLAARPREARRRRRAPWRARRARRRGSSARGEPLAGLRRRGRGRSRTPPARRRAGRRRGGGRARRAGSACSVSSRPSQNAWSPPSRSARSALLGQRAVVVGVAVADGVVEALRGVLADRLEHREAAVLVADQAVGGERVRGRAAVASATAAAASSSQPPANAASAWKRSRSAVRRAGRRSRRSRRRGSAGGRAGRALGARAATSSSASGSRSSDSQTAATLVAGLDLRPGGAGAGDEQRHGLVPQRERLDRVDVLAVEPQRAPARDQAAQAAARPRSSVGDRRRRLVDVLEVVEQAGSARSVGSSQRRPRSGRATSAGSRSGARSTKAACRRCCAASQRDPGLARRRRARSG